MVQTQLADPSTTDVARANYRGGYRTLAEWYHAACGMRTRSVNIRAAWSRHCEFAIDPRHAELVDLHNAAYDAYAVSVKLGMPQSAIDAARESAIRCAMETLDYVQDAERRAEAAMGR